MAERKSVFWVWRRSDGYVGCTRGANPPQQQRIGGLSETFEVLLETDSWQLARAKLVVERDDAHHDLVASWTTDDLCQGY